jgi:hydroxyacylglutathione hydrolase
MIRIKVFVFNPFQENTYVLHDETNECIIIDPVVIARMKSRNLCNL